MATPQQIETKLRAPRCLNNIPFSARAQCPGTGTKSGRGLRQQATIFFKSNTQQAKSNVQIMVLIVAVVHD